MKKIIKIIKSLILFGKLIHNIDNKRLFITTVLFILLPLSDIMFSVWLLNYIITGYERGISINNFLPIMSALLIFQILVWWLESYYFQLYSHNSNLKISGVIHKKLYEKIKDIELEEIENKEFYKEYYFILNDCEQRICEFMELHEKLVSSLVMILTLSTIILFSDPILFMIILLPIVVDVIITPRINKVTYDFDRQMKEEERGGEYVRRVMYLNEYSKEIRTTRILNVIMKQYNLYLKNSILLIRKYGLKIALCRDSVTFLYQIVSFFATVLYISVKVLNGSLEMSSGVIIISLYNQIVYSFKNIVSIYSDSIKQALYIDNMVKFMNRESKNREDCKYKEFPQNIYSIEFRNISFKYNSNKYALKDVNFIIHRGEKVAVLGSNGAGKSTLVKIMLRLYEPCEGSIFINGINIKEYEVNEYRKRIGTVLQNFRIFATDLERNILYKTIDNKEEEVIFNDAILKSGFLDKYKILNSNSKAVLTKEFDSNGVVLSGGEMQKIAIARSIAKNSDIMIMDEPTSALDPIAEYNFYKVLENNFNDKILVFISHNYSTGIFADKIIYLENGIIIESGTHEALLKLNGKYSNMYMIQADNFNCEPNEVEEC